MGDKNTLEIPMLHKLLRADFDAGKLYWRKRGVEMFSDGIRTAKHNANVWNSRYAETEAFTAVTGNGYKHGKVFGCGYRAHRVLFAMRNGHWPVDHIDHLNGIRSDNRIVNLRAVSNQENNRNAAKPSNNTSGVVGVCWDKTGGKWIAAIGVDGKSKRIGSFADFADAVAARKAAEEKHGFHENHGRNQ